MFALVFLLQLEGNNTPSTKPTSRAQGADRGLQTTLWFAEECAAYTQAEYA